jgi:hypothetical protein
MGACCGTGRSGADQSCRSRRKKERTLRLHEPAPVHGHAGEIPQPFQKLFHQVPAHGYLHCLCLVSLHAPVLETGFQMPEKSEKMMKEELEGIYYRISH